MAEEKAKIVLERTYNVPLRKEFQKAPKYKRAKKAGIALRQFLTKHMKSDNINIGRHLNMKLWEKGIKNPPHHVNVVAKKDEAGKVEAELVGAVDKKAAKPVKKEAKKPAKSKKPAKLKTQDSEPKTDNSKPKTEAKEEKTAEKKVEKKAEASKPKTENSKLPTGNSQLKTAPK